MENCAHATFLHILFVSLRPATRALRTQPSYHVRNPRNGFIARSALFLLLLLWGGTLPAQNGITLSDVAVEAGTVTFNVRWESAGMPKPWLDSAWVFVEYNNNGVMTRLPLSTGATLTATSPGGKVIEEQGNNKGLWVVGNARTEGAFSATVQLLTTVTGATGACAYASSYPPVGKYTATKRMSFTGTSPYTIVIKKDTDGTTENRTSGNTFIEPEGYAVHSFTDKTGAPGIIYYGTSQSQGSCSYTEPAVVGKFADFPAGYSASTYVTLTDGRDNKNYPVVKIGGRWIMARNLNYQKDLTWQANPNSPSTISGGGVTELIGHFWCPGGVNGGPALSSSSYSCEVWGALYSWETAMMVDGKWSDDNHSSSTWTEPDWSDNSGSGNTNNGGRGAKGQGICPPNWHVPTDEEWGVLLNAMESTSSGRTHNTDNDYMGVDAGARGKSKCMCPVEDCATDENVSWSYDSSAQGTDFYGFRVLPSGYRGSQGDYLSARGDYAHFWSSSAADSEDAWYRAFLPNEATVSRENTARSYGYSVRCIRD